MMQMSLDEWNAKLSIVNYDQGWSMVHFLIHGDGGKYRQAFGAFMLDLSRNRPWPVACPHAAELPLGQQADLSLRRPCAALVALVPRSRVACRR